jgi:hypothetical protein
MGGNSDTLTFTMQKMAKMGRPRREHCVICGRHVSEVGPLSKRGKCRDDGRARMNDNHDAMIEHDGPFFDHWRRQCLAAFGVLVLDGTDERP